MILARLYGHLVTNKETDEHFKRKLLSLTLWTTLIRTFVQWLIYRFHLLSQKRKQLLEGLFLTSRMPLYLRTHLSPLKNPRSRFVIFFVCWRFTTLEFLSFRKHLQLPTVAPLGFAQEKKHLELCWGCWLGWLLLSILCALQCELREHLGFKRQHSCCLKICLWASSTFRWAQSCYCFSSESPFFPARETQRLAYFTCTIPKEVCLLIFVPAKMNLKEFSSEKHCGWC